MFDRAPTFHVGAYILWTKDILHRRSCFLDLEYFMSADILIDADILIGADILIDADILIVADILGRQHFRAPTF